MEMVVLIFNYYKVTKVNNIVTNTYRMTDSSFNANV